MPNAIQTNKDIEKASSKSLKTIGKTLEKSGAATSNYATNHQARQEKQDDTETASDSLTSSFRKKFEAKYDDTSIKKEVPTDSRTLKKSSSILNSIKTRVIPTNEVFENSEDIASPIEGKFSNRVQALRDNSTKALNIFGKTAQKSGKSLRKLSTASNVVSNTVDGSDTSGGIKTLENGSQKIKKKIAFKTSQYAGKKTLKYGQIVTKTSYKKIKSSILSKDKISKGAKSVSKIFTNIMKVASKTIGKSLLQLSLPMLSGIGAISIAFVFIAVLGAGSSSSISPISGDPDFTNVEAWQSPNNPYAPTFYGQCTWFAWGRFYEIYGYSPGFLGNGNECVWELLEAHPDKFVFSKTPIPGAVGSSDFDHNHVFIVVDVDGDLLTIQDGNMNGVTDNWEVAITDWRKATFTMEEYSSYFGDLVFANPIYLPKED